MNLSTLAVRTAADAVCAREGVDVAGMGREHLLALAADAAALRRAADVVMAQVAAEVDRRSTPDDGVAGLAASRGFRSAGELIARSTGGSVAEARRLVVAGGLMADAGEAGSPAVAADAAVGEASVSPLARLRADLGLAAREGRLSVEGAATFASALAGLPDDDHTRDLFVRALAKAEGLGLPQVRALVWRAQALADPGAWAEREERQHGQRCASVRDEADGMVTLTARLTPLAAAPVRAVLDAAVRRAMQERRDDPSSDDRTAWQMRADALVELCRHALDCDRPTSGVKTTVVVRMTREELESGLGIGEVDGAPQPVSVGALRAACADAELIPVVLGGASEVLEMGRSRRLFTPAQRLALVERDAGCSWCHAPPSWCDAHHIKWWERDAGPTDLSNGVLLCVRCHHRVHRDDWEIAVRDGAVWFTPPRSVDPARVPRVGGRRRFDLAA